MLSRSRQTRLLLARLCDGLLFATALALAYVLRAWFPFFDLPAIERFTEHLWLFPVFALTGPLSLATQGFYRDLRFNGRLGTLLIVLRSVVINALVLIALLFLLRLQFARSVILLACGFGGVFAYLRHEWLAPLLSPARPWRHRVLWLGQPEANQRLREALTAAEAEPLESVGELDPAQASPAQLTALLHEHSVNTVIVNLAGSDASRLPPLLQACEREGVELIIRPGIFSHSPASMAIDWFAGEPVVHYRAQQAPESHLILKQMIDWTGALLALVVLAPLLLLLSVLIRLTSAGPVFFVQERAGLNGRPFRMFKFRSMRAGAEQQQAALTAYNEMSGPVFKLADDPRITALGRLLRRHSLDELPQLWNVLRGEMSLVGPRPLPIEEVRRFSDDAHRRRLSVRPGMTCLWQISGRNEITRFEDWVRLDLAYIDQWSLWLDCKILLGTLPVVLFGRGGR